MSDQGNNLVTTVGSIVAVVVTIVSGWTAYKTSTQDELIKNIETNLKERQYSSELMLKIYDEFVKSITVENASCEIQINRLDAVRVLTNVIPTEKLAVEMSRTVEKALERLQTRDECADKQNEIVTAKFDATQQVATVESSLSKTQSMASGWSNYDVDIFWCESNRAFENSASDILRLKNSDSSATGRWRIRPLPEIVNARVGYGVRGFEIRYSSADELPRAETLKAMMRSELNLDARLVSTSQDTPWYISVFACPQ